MPLLFKNGKLVVNDIDQLVFSDDPNSCRCCPGLCQCDDGSTPQYLSDVSVAFSNVQDTYSEEIDISEVVQYSDGVVDEFILKRSFEISGISGLNGTYPFSLKTLPNLDSDCVQPDPIPPCAFDTNTNCLWVVNAPTVFVSGAFRNREFVRRDGVIEIDKDQTLYISGYAVGFPNNSATGLRSTATIRVFLCVRQGSYSGDSLATFNLTFGYQWATAQGFGDLIEVIRSQNVFLNDRYRYRLDCTESISIPTPFVQFGIFQKGFPQSILPYFSFLPGSLCDGPSFGGASVIPVWCYDNTLPSTSYTINGCQGSNVYTQSAPPTFGARGYNRTLTTSYDYDGYAFDSSWNYTLDPP